MKRPLAINYLERGLYIKALEEYIDYLETFMTNWKARKDKHKS